MTTKAAFNADEWAVVSSAPALTGLLVVSASRGGTLRESVALSRAYTEARAAGPSPLLADLLATTPPAAKVAERPRSAEELERFVLDRLRAALTILGQRAAYEEVAEYKRFVYGLAESVARAHKEGGFLGVGGQLVSEGEQAVLDKVVALFDATDAPPPEVEAALAPEAEPLAPEAEPLAPEFAPPASGADVEPAPEADAPPAPAAPEAEADHAVGRWAPPKPGA